MSRLNSFIRRMSAQRDCLNLTAELLEGKSGPVLEVGLGNGRTFDHLRSLFDADDIYVFDRHVKAHPDCIPDDHHMILGDLLETLPAALPRIGGLAKLAHCDIGSGDKASSVALAKTIGAYLDDLLQEGAIIASDQPFEMDNWTACALPDGVAEGRYHIYRKN